MHKLKILQNYYTRNDKIYSKKTVSIKEGLTILCGCNGSGKSTLLKQLKDHLDENNIPCITYNNLYDGGDRARDLLGEMGDYKALATGLISSEGENITQNVGRFASKLGEFIRRNTNAPEVFVLLDAVDSGLSIDNIITLKDLCELVIHDGNRRGIKVYVLVSANSYELARGEQCLDTPNLTYRKFKDYEEYREYIIQTRDNKEKDGG